MGSDSKKAPKARHKFSFSGSTKQPALVAPRSARVSNDEILESMTKQVHPVENVPEQFPQVGHASPLQELNETAPRSKMRNRGSARGALVIFLGSFLAVWLYGYATGAYEIPYMRTVTQSPEIQTGIQAASTHPLLFGAVSGSLLLGALGLFYLRHKRNR